MNKMKRLPTHMTVKDLDLIGLSEVVMLAVGCIACFQDNAGAIVGHSRTYHGNVWTAKRILNEKGIKVNLWNSSNVA